MRILIVEDEPLIASLVADVLTDGGHEVAGVASNFRSACERAERARPDLALVDIQLAGGDSGIDVARALSALGIASILVSSDGCSARGNRDAAVGYLAKPWRPDALLESIEAACVILHGEPPACVPVEFEVFRHPRPLACAA